MTLRVCAITLMGVLTKVFGDHGKVTTDVGDGKASSLAVQDNKIIVAGLRTTAITMSLPWSATMRAANST